MPEKRPSTTELKEAAVPSSAITNDPTAGPGMPGRGEDNTSGERERREDGGEYMDGDEEGPGSALLEPSTLPWPGDKGGGGGAEDEEEKLVNRSPVVLEDTWRKDKWRESMPEGERWREDEPENGGSLADDDDDVKKGDCGSVSWLTEKPGLVFTPKVNIRNPLLKDVSRESPHHAERIPDKEPEPEPAWGPQYESKWTEEDDQYIYVCENVCSEKLKVALGIAAALLLFPFLLWGGYSLLPFDAPLLEGAPLRVVYTLHCAFFAIVPILLGVVVQGVARLRFGQLSPLYQGKLESREVAVHWHYVNDSLLLFLLFFLQLTVTATYIDQDLLKLVPLLSIVFSLGRLIYWVCLSLGSSLRGLGFGLSFFPILVMLGANLYYVCSSVGQGAVFDVEPPTTPPPMPRWFG